jgi:hypothetical protein
MLGSLRDARTRFLGAAVALVVSGCAGRSEIADGQDAGPELDASPQPDAGPDLLETSDQLDLLFVIDNSRNLDVAQELFTATLPYLLERLVNPACVNGLGTVVAQPSSPDAPCPVGKRDIPALRDFRIAVISTSLGGHGADVCSPASPSFDPMQNDRAHLLTRGGGGGVVPTYGNKGFLAWDPGAGLTPPGDTDLAAFTVKLGELVRGVGLRGCGYEAPLESVYRFLVDPEPYAEVTLVDGVASPIGIDAVLLQQRQDFLRPGSAVMTLLMTDENDCSTREGGQFYLSNQIQVSGGAPFHMPRARSVCASDPRDPCCASCGQAIPDGCAPDPICQQPPLSEIEDPVNLRCFDQKRRFGLDFLYPVQRYIDGFTSRTVANRQGVLVDNPLYAGGRSPELVLFTGILGVPWQDLANDANSLSTGYRQATLIDWGLVVGDAQAGTLPLDPLMVESVTPRSGVHPPTGDELSPPSAPTPLANPVNGHERIIAGQDDLQFACIYPRPTPLSCEGGACDCVPPDIETNPVCQQEDGSYGGVQRFARALPSIRPLRFLQGLGERAAVASICAPVTAGTAQPTFGYKPAVDAMLRGLRSRIR